MCQALIKFGADVSKIDVANLYEAFWKSESQQIADTKFWFIFWQWAASIGDIEKCKQLFESGATLNPNDETEENLPLYIASQNGHFELSQWMINKGADITPCMDALLFCYAKNEKLELCKQMMEKGGDMNKKIVGDQTPWTIMCQSGNLEGVKMFLDKGADPSYPGCLQLAIEFYHNQVAQELIDQGCKVNQVGKIIISAIK